MFPEFGEEHQKKHRHITRVWQAASAQVQGAMHICIFCGKQAPANYKNLQPSFVQDIVKRQVAAGIDEPIVNLLRETIAEKQRKADRTTGAADEGSECEDDEEALHSCMCCYYWVVRRQKQKIVPLPMQNLLWYVRTLEGCESKRCDSRILLRLLKTITESGNMYARLFHTQELEGMAAIKQHARRAAVHGNTQGNDVFCVKRQLAALWHANNGQSLLLGHAQAADLLR